jgi:hypothetical protein
MGRSMADALANLIIPRYKNDYHPLLLRKNVLAVFTVGVLVFNIFTASIGGRLYAGAVESAALVSLTNQERTTAGLSSLRVDPRLVAAAHAKAQNIFELQYWSHYGPNGESPWQFIIGSGYSYVYAGENLAKGFSSSEAVHSAWMASETHRTNIMGAQYEDIGIAVVPGVLQGTEVILVVQMFGSLENTAPQSPISAAGTTTGTTQAAPGTQAEEAAVSIDITYPGSEAVIADDDFVMEGTVTDSVDTIYIEDNDSEPVGVISEAGVWDYRPDDGWKEGAHDVEVRDEDETASAQVSFEVDTTPPVIDESSLRIEKADVAGNIKISVAADGTAAEATLIAGDFSIALVQEDDNVFSATVPEWEFSSDEHARILVSDELGNFAEIDVTESVLGTLSVDNGNSDVTFGRFPVDISQLVTRIAVILIALLLVVDVVYLFKLKIIHTRGKTLFPMAVWLVVMGVAMVVGTGGSIL